MIDLVLIEDVDNLGKRGERVAVKPGFARNHLIPLSLAVHVTEENLRMVEKHRVQWLAEEAKLIEELKELAGHVGQLDLTISGRASEHGHLYGSVTEKDIAAAAAAAGVAFDTKHVKIAQHLKEVGDYDVLIRLHEQVEITIPVRVRAEGEENWTPDQEDSAGVETSEAAVSTADDAVSGDSGETPPSDG